MRGLWLTGSLVLHVAVLAMLRQPAPSTPLPIQLSLTRTPLPIQLSLTRTPLPPPIVTPLPAPGPRARPERTRGTQQDAGAPATDASPAPGLSTMAPRVLSGGITVPAPGAPVLRLEAPTGALSAFVQDDGLDEKTRVEGVVKQTVDAAMVLQDTRTGARGTARTLKHALVERFSPRPELVQHIPNSAASREQQARNRQEAFTRPQSTAVYGNALTPAQQAHYINMPDPSAVSHEVGRLSLRVRIEHAADGQVSSVRVLASSGSEAFDAYAQGVVRQAVASHLPSEPDEATPLYSEWSLSQVVYDWHGQTFGDSAGQPVFPPSRAITYTNDIKLEAVRYRR